MEHYDGYARFYGVFQRQAVMGGNHGKKTSNDQETNMTRGPDKKFTTQDLAEDEDPRNQPARPDPRTGEVPAGPGDAGLTDRIEANAGSPGTKQMSNRRLGIGLGIAALLSILAFIFARVF